MIIGELRKLNTTTKTIRVTDWDKWEEFVEKWGNKKLACGVDGYELLCDLGRKFTKTAHNYPLNNSLPETLTEQQNNLKIKQRIAKSKTLPTTIKTICQGGRPTATALPTPPEPPTFKALE
ncbi:hypothetical protein BDZ91DRAFT_729591 [Kalaharituber pfeilii]|nr:hypothetical protein BDZ91DRAFT_729591 [Kalaharituber pfeilii]